MKIQFASDLHLEFYESEQSQENLEALFESFLTKNKEADVLILAGDIGYPEEPITQKFLEWCCNFWPHVVWIFGNHEYYNKNRYKREKVLTMADKELFAEKLCEKLKNLHFLQNDRLILKEFPNFRIIGTTLWTDISPENGLRVASSLNDFSLIYTSSNDKMNLRIWRDLYAKMRQFIENELYEAFNKNQKVIVVTHHMPTWKMIQPQYAGSPINSGFAANCDDLLEHNAVATWICGHSHGAYEIEIENSMKKKIKCYLNSRGYKHEDCVENFNKNKIIELL